MASSIQILRSTTPKERPYPNTLLEGQPAVNLSPNEPGLFFKASDGSLLKIGPTALTFDGSAPNSSPAGQGGNCVGELWYDGSTSPGILKVFDGASWLSSGSPNAITDITAGTNVAVARTGNSVAVSAPNAITDILPGSNITVARAGSAVTISSTGGGGSGVASLLRWSTTATAGQTTLSGTDSTGQTLSYTAGLEEVYINGVFLRRGVDYTASNGTSIVLASPLTLNDEISVLAWTPFTVTSNIPASNVTYDTPNATTRTAQAKLGDLTSAKDFGAAGDDVNDDRFAFNAYQSSSATYVLITPGTYRLGDDYTFYKPVIFMPGAIIKTPHNLTFTSTIDAEAYQIFDMTGGGIVTLSNGGPQTIGYPEWWGARKNNNGPGVADKNIAAINACIAACAETIFSSGDYWISTPIRVTTSYRTIRGPNRGSVGGNQKGITRIILSSGSANVMEIETQGLPVSSSLWIQEIIVENLCIHRSIMPICPALGSEATGPKGISVRNTVWVQLRNVWTAEHYIGVYINNTIRTRLWETVSFRSLPASNTTAGPDRFFGFFQDGFGGSFAGGNASTYYQECTTFQGGNPFPRSEMIGFFMNGANSDTYMLRCETTAVGTGVLIDGAGVTGGQIRSGFADVFLTEFVIDQFSEAGIKILNTSDWTAIAVNSGYSAPAGTALAPNPSAGLHIENCTGLISCSNYQNISWPSPSCRGLYIKDSTGVRSVGGMWVESERPIELDGSNSCSVEDGVRNVNVTTTQAAVLLTNSDKNYVKSTVYGDAGRYTIGVDVPSGSSYNEINTTGVDSAAVIGGVSNVLRINGSSVTTPGTYNTNLASGIIA